MLVLCTCIELIRECGNTLYVGMGMASLIRTIQTGLSVSLLFLVQAQLYFLHLENNAEDDVMSAQTPPEQCQQLAPAAV